MADVQKDVFTKHYSSLCNTLTDVSNLLPYFVQENIINTGDVEEINAIAATTKKVEKLLNIISGPLTAGNNKGFHLMLTIMKEHGSQTTKDLAADISHEVTSLSNNKERRTDDDGHKSGSKFHQAGSPTIAAASDERSMVKTADPLSAQFSIFVATIEDLLDRCHDKLEQCKKFCSNLKVSGNSDELLFNDEQLQKINACSTFTELFTMLRKYWSWNEYSILTHIISITDLKEAKDELKLFRTRMGSYQGMKILSESISPEAITTDYIRLSIIIEEPYRELTLEKFTELRDFIFKNLDIKPYIALPFIKFLYSSLHLEWYVLNKATDHMIKMAHQNKEILISNSVVFIQIDQYVALDCRAKDIKQIDDPKLTSSNYTVPTGGYDYNLVNAPPDQLMCKICHLPCHEAQQSECCGSIYCKHDINQLRAITTMQLTCPICHAKDFVTHPNIAIDHEIQQLTVYCPNKEAIGCDWTGHVKDVGKHYSYGKECETECEKCKTTVKHKLLHSHITNDCPCYCSYCGITAEREVITSQHKEKCHKFPQTSPRMDNDKSITINESQNGTFGKLIEMFNPSRLLKLMSIQMVQECSDKVDKQNTTLLNRLCSIQSCLAIAILIMAILLYLPLQSPIILSENDMREELQLNLLEIDISEYIAPEVNNDSMLIHKHTSKFEGMDNETKQFLSSLQAKLEEANKHHQVVTEFETVTSQEFYYYYYHYYQLSNSFWSIFSEIPNQVLPFNVTMSSFTMKLKKKKGWYSTPFFAFDGGYQMCLRIDAAGYGSGEGSHVSVFLFLMKGPYDDELEQSGHWPLRGTFTIEIINQFNNNDYYSYMVQFHHYFCSECTDRVLEGFMADSGRGQQQFIAHDTLLHHSDFLKSDSLIFRISYEDAEPPYQVAPVTFNVTHFSWWLESKTVWYSNPFFAFDEGYQMCLKVYAAGVGSGEGSHVSVYLFLMKGPYDDELEQSGHWPLRGTFTIELLNQFNNSDHYSHIVLFHHYLCSECTDRVLEGFVANSGRGEPQFISHDTLLYHSSNDYYKRGSVIFRISYEDTEPPYQVTPATFKVVHFSRWWESKEKWYSSPFFAFNKGYLMCSKIHVTGYVSSEDSHLSVYLYLMKGPYDDELEQSGHWPLRGTFTIELLNQFNDSNHYSYIVQFHHYWCSKCTNRVLEGFIANSGCGQQQFIARNTLLHHSNFLKNDSLIFRISYEDAEPPYRITPVTFNVTHFSWWLDNKAEWYSSPFFAFDGGYQMCLKVYAAGDSSGEGSHVSVYLFLMKGPYDDELEQSGHWPLRGTFTIELLNQFNDSDHYSRKVQFYHYNSTNRVLEGVIANVGQGKAQFISHDILLYHSKITYYESDSLIFRISYEDADPPYQIAPVSLMVIEFSWWFDNKEKWYMYSSPFFAFDGGYQMCLKVHANGYGIGEGSHVSVYLLLMKGPYDDELEQSGHWPLRGTFTIELLNQFNDSDHYSYIVQFHHHFCSECTDRVLEGFIANAGQGEPQFISHDTLLYHSNSDYYISDFLMFRISYEDADPPNQIAPVTLKFSRFSQWVKSKRLWLSSSFFAFEEGYQLFLSVKPVGYGNDDTYVSVFLHLMKGPYDDELEHSGHWPLRGKFTIELLNQNNNSDYYSPSAIYIPRGSGNRVNEEGDRVEIEAVFRFISHDTLFQHNGYLKNDSIYFRICYLTSDDDTKGLFITF